MHSVLEPKAATRSRRFAVIAATAIGAALIAFYFGQNEPSQDSAVSAPAPAANAVFGPGAWTGTAADASISNRGESNPAAPGGLATTENQELIVNSALLDVINFFLLERSDGNRINALRSHLKSNLPDPAYREAEQIVGHYQAYMTEYDNLLAAQNLGAQSAAMSSLDLSRIATWCEQRDRLRKNVLGDKVTEAWYQNDDAQLKQVVDELRQHRDGASQEQGQDPSSQYARPMPPVAPRWSNVADEVHHNLYMQEVLAKATTSFEALAVARRDWSISYAAFVDAASQVNRDSSLGSFDRNLQIHELLKKSFRSESDRQLAQNRWESVNGALD